MKEDAKELVKNGAEMGVHMLMVALLGRAENAPNKSLDFIEMQYISQEVLGKIKTMSLLAPNKEIC